MRWWWSLVHSAWHRLGNRCTASTQRGLGPSRQTLELPIPDVHKLALSSAPIADGGPICLKEFAALCSFHVVRGAEAANALASALTVDPTTCRETWFLPFSKTDVQAWRSTYVGVCM